MSRGNWQGRRLGPGQYTRSTLAVEVGVHHDTIVRWQREGLLEGEKTMGMWVFGEHALAVAMRLANHQEMVIDRRVELINEEVESGRSYTATDDPGRQIA